MNNDKYRLSSFQLFALILGVVVGGGLVNIPADLALVVEHEGWISVLMAGAFTFIIIQLGLSINKDYPDKNILEISEYILGKYPGKILNGLLTLYFILIAGISVRVALNLILTWSLPKTPIEVLIIFYLFNAAYLGRNGLQSVARFSEVIVIMLLPILLLVFLPFREWNFIELQPFAKQSISTYFAGAAQSFYSFLGFEIIFLVYPYVRRSHKRIQLVSSISLGYIIFGYFSMVLFATASFGAERLKGMLYTIINYSQAINLPVIERVDFLLIFFWTFALFHTTALLYYMGTFSLRHVFSLGKNWSFYLILPTYYIALYPQNPAELSKYSKYVSNGGIAVIFFTLVILKVGSYFKKNKANPKN